MNIEDLPLLGHAPESLETRALRAQMATALFGLEAPDVMKIGRFVLTKELGVGGQGVVYEAEDPELDRRVALKRLSVDAPGHRDRMRKEGRALARVDHPNVVRIHEVGEDETDRMYLVMELVQGRSLDQWLVESTHHWTEVVEKMAAVGEGLAAIHEAGMLHRDIKPHNIVMQDDGTAKLIDLGIAVLDAVGGAPGQDDAVGTAGYIAPERFSGRLDARSDQYGFCVTLYEALHGVRPPLAMTRSASVDSLKANNRQRRPALREIIDETKPAGAPSVGHVAIDDAPGRLQAVLARGMQQDPNRRYADMRELVVALRDTLPRPRRWQTMALAGLVAAGAGLGVALAASGGGTPGPCDTADPARSLWSETAKERVRDAFSRADGSDADRAFAVVDGMVMDATQALDGGWAHACALPREASARPVEVAALQSKHQALRAIVEALAAFQGAGLSQVTVRLGSELARLRESGPRDACEQTEAMLEATPLVVEIEDLRRRSSAEWIAGRYDVALTLAGEALELAEGEQLEPVRVRLQYDRGRMALEGLHVEQALRDLDDARSQAEVLGCDGVGAQAHALYAKAELVGGHGSLERADQASRVALQKLERTGTRGTRRVDALKSRGLVKQRRGAFAEAAEHNQEALAILAASNDPDLLATTDIMLNLGVTQAQWGKRDEAIATLKEAIEIREGALWPDHPSMYKLHSSLSRRLLNKGDLPASKAAQARALEIATAGLGPEHPRVATLHIAMAQVLSYQHEWNDALRHAQKADGVLARAHGPRDLRRIDGLEAIGRVHMGAGAPALAIPVLTQALEIQAGSDKATAWDLVIGRGTLARAYARNSELATALLLYEQAYPIVEADPAGRNHPFVPEMLAGWGEALVEADRHAEAAEHLTKAESWWAERGTNPERLAHARWWLAQAKCTTAPERAQALARAALEYFESAQAVAAQAVAANRMREEILEWLKRRCVVAQ
ncbi:MAG: serine/threonine-protein kinase [Deltaproteobacteria bacterium]|nr:serine/threonine-protein kinase [Deltaproteobacteria bacterium]